jgi:hypothetical protein
MAVTGTHMLLYTTEADAARAVLRDVFGWHHVDAHDGWLIFRLPPAEIAVHPTDGKPFHQVSFMCDDLVSTIAELRGKPGISFRGEMTTAPWGSMITMVLPGDLDLLLYQPRHPTAI